MKADRAPEPGAQDIVFVNRFFYPDQSATSRMLSDLAFALAGEGRKVRVITSRGLYDDASADLPDFETHAGVAIHRVYRPRFSRASLLGRALDYIAMYAAFAQASRRLTRKGDWIVVKTDPPLLGAALAPVSQLKGLRQINWLQDIYPELALALGLRWLKPLAPALLALRNRSLGSPATNVVIGERMRDHVRAAGVDDGRIAVIPNWCDDEAIRPLPNEQNALRSTWGLTDKFVVGYSGNLGRAHEYRTLLGAAQKLRGQKDILFLFIGGGHLTRSLKDEVASLGLNDAFRFLPYQPDEALPQSLCAPDVHWLSQPAAMEGLILPSKFYGIAAAGRPIIVIGDRQGELAQLVQRHDCGKAIEAGDSDSLAELILLLRSDEGRRTELGANARRMLDDGMTRRRAFERWRALFDRL